LEALTIAVQFDNSDHGPAIVLSGARDVGAVISVDSDARFTSSFDGFVDRLRKWLRSIENAERSADL